MMKKVAIMQPYLFPYIGYFQLIAAVDTFVIYDDVNYINKGWINRNNILMGGQPSLFTVPLKGASQNLLIHQIELDNLANWSKKFLKTIDQAYKKAPEFEPVRSLLHTIFNQEFRYIRELNLEAITGICLYLSINTDIVVSSSFYNNKELKAENRILDICLREKATQYINPIGGQGLYDKNHFDEHGIILNFIRTKSIAYQQFKPNFVPWLSIIDVLMFNRKEEVHSFLSQYELI